MVEIDNLDFFGYNGDQKKLLALLAEAKKPKSKTRLLLMVAPSFVVDFDPADFVPKMKGLGFDKVTELTFGAKIVNEQYHKYIHEHFSAYAHGEKKGDNNFQGKFISSVCPASVELVRHSHPELAKYLMPFVSPMGAMAKIARKNFPAHAVVFLSPCSAKKFEAAQYVEGKVKKRRQLIEVAVTFAEMKQILAKEKPKKKGASIAFDSFYNDYTKIYPLSGGLSATMHYKGLLHKNKMVSCDGCTNLIKLFNSHPKKVFYDVLFCKGGCIGGPGVASKAPLFVRKRRVFAYRNSSQRVKKKNGSAGADKYTKGIDFSRAFS